MEKHMDIQTPSVSGNAAHPSSFSRAWTEDEINQRIDARVNFILEGRGLRMVDDTREERMRRLALYGGLGLAGAAVGTAVTLEVQRIRRNRAMVRTNK